VGSADEPPQVRKRAIDATPLVHGVWCSHFKDGSQPFVNPIVRRAWADDGKRVTLMLDSFNFMFALPEEEVDVVEIEPIYSDRALVDRVLAEDRERMRRPVRPDPDGGDGG
jgi:hypothetical protein